MNLFACYVCGHEQPGPEDGFDACEMCGSPNFIPAAGPVGEAVLLGDDWEDELVADYPYVDFSWIDSGSWAPS